VVYERTGSTAQTGFLFGLRVVPSLRFGVIAGRLADRGNRGRLMIGETLVEGRIVSVIAIAHLLDVLTIAAMHAMALVSATAVVFSDPALFAAAVFAAVPAVMARPGSPLR
jgi:hypothetical protein